MSAVKDAIGSLGGGFMRSREVVAAGQEAGYRGRQTYFAGRCGVLGDVDADVVVAAAVFFPRDVVRRAWEGSRPVEPRAQAVARYAAAAHAWAGRKLAGFGDAGRLAELLERVVEAVDPVAAPLAAGWRAVPLPEDPRARTVQLAHVLREHRGAMHGVAVLAEGLTPLQAILTGEHAQDGARYFGWRPPFPPLEPGLVAARGRAEALTDELAARPYAVLEPGERAELADLLGAALTAVSAG